MNSKQRRKAYRAMPKAGSPVQWSQASGAIKSGIAIGPQPIHRDQWGEERANVPNVHRLRVRLLGGTHAHPLVSRLIGA